MAEKPLSTEQKARAEALILKRMQEGEFTFSNLHMLADRELGIGRDKNDPTTYRVADRLIQRERKAGRIEQIRRGVWLAARPESSK